MAHEVVIKYTCRINVRFAEFSPLIFSLSKLIEPGHLLGD